MKNINDEMKYRHNYIVQALHFDGYTESDEVPEEAIDEYKVKWDNMSDYEKTLYHFVANDNGRYGKAFEMNVKHYLNGNRGNSHKVSAKGKDDVKFHGNVIEIKSNCGELERIPHNDYVVYTMDNRKDYCKPWQAVVIPAKEFFDLMQRLGLVRSKKTTAGYIKTTIQTYNNSNRKTALLANALAEYPTLEDWKSNH